MMPYWLWLQPLSSSQNIQLPSHCARCRTTRLKHSSITEFQSITGMGVQALVDGQLVQIGADRFMHSLDISTDEFSAQAQQLGEAR